MTPPSDKARSIPINSIRDIAVLVRGRRRELELSQAELAKRMGVSRQWIAAFEAGKPRAGLQLVIRLVDTLGLRLSVEQPTAGDRGQPEPPSADIDLDALLDRHREP